MYKTLIWTIIGALLGAIFGSILTIIINRRNSRILLRSWKWQKCIDFGIVIDPNITISVINDSKITLPLLNVHIMDFSGINIKLERVDTELHEIKPGQITNYFLKVLESENELSKDAKQILSSKPEKFAVRIYLDKSNKGPVHTDKVLAKSIFHTISQLVGRDFKKETLLDDMSLEERKKVLEELNQFSKK